MCRLWPAGSLLVDAHGWPQWLRAATIKAGPSPEEWPAGVFRWPMSCPFTTASVAALHSQRSRTSWRDAPIAAPAARSARRANTRASTGPRTCAASTRCSAHSALWYVTRRRTKKTAAGCDCGLASIVYRRLAAVLHAHFIECEQFRFAACAGVRHLADNSGVIAHGNFTDHAPLDPVRG